MNPANTCDLLLSGGTVVTMDDERRILEPGAVAINGDRIIAVGTSKSSPTCAPGARSTAGEWR
ncbi:hypothetical protein [Saccharopolyspora shandongensis]|uniref:hypothetical protein n=1 Tax=Saccharopolyspora shandongensis TaxID=418495 RepID=UPI0033E99259